MTVREVLKEKSGKVVTIEPESTVNDALKLLEQNRIGALVVSKGGETAEGILSERDIVRNLARLGPEILDQPVSNIMTREVYFGTPSHNMVELMAIMTSRRIRHFPIMEDGKMVGIISIGDVVKRRLHDLEFEADNLKRYIAGHGTVHPPASLPVE